MASRIMNRRELRKQSDHAEQAEAAVNGTAAVKVKKKAKEVGPPKVRKPRKKKEPVRMCAHWAVYDGGMKQVAIFDYNQRGAADQKLAELSTKKGTYFLQIVKQPMPQPEPEPVTAVSA